MRIVQLDEHAVVAFFPSDHYYFQEGKFIGGITSGYELAELHEGNIILLGAVADRPETEYGWIEPETPVANRSGNRLTRVRRFWEKPSSEIAKRLLEQGCLWNTFVGPMQPLQSLSAILSLSSTTRMRIPSSIIFMEGASAETGRQGKTKALPACGGDKYPGGPSFLPSQFSCSLTSPPLHEYDTGRHAHPGS